MVEVTFWHPGHMGHLLRQKLLYCNNCNCYCWWIRPRWAETCHKLSATTSKSTTNRVGLLQDCRTHQGIPSLFAIQKYLGILHGNSAGSQEGLQAHDVFMHLGASVSTFFKPFGLKVILKGGEKPYTLFNLLSFIWWSLKTFRMMMKNQESKSLGELWLLLFKSRTKNIFWGLNSLLELSFGARSCGDLRVMCFFKPTSCFHLSIDHKQRERHHLKFYIASLIRLSIMHHEDPRSVPWSASKIHRQPCKTSFFQPFPLVFPPKRFTKNQSECRDSHKAWSVGIVHVLHP